MKKTKYILIDRQERSSTLNGGSFWRLKFYCLNDGSFWEMTVDSAYNNFKRNGWNIVVTEENPYGAYTNLKRTDRKTADDIGVLTADSRGELLVRVADQEEALALAELDQDNRKRKNQFGSLFDVE